MTTVKTISPRQAQREKLREQRRRQAITHLTDRIKTLEIACVNGDGSLFQKEQMRNSITFLTKVRDTTLYNLDASLGLKPRQPKHRRVSTQLDQALEVDAAFATLGTEPQPAMDFLA